MHTVPVLLAGGIGERFWPMSRSRRPKQLLPLSGRRTMIEETLNRIAPLCRGGSRPIIVTSSRIASGIRKTLDDSHRCRFIVEPVGKNTAPAIAIAAASIQKRHGDSVMVILPADHAISPRSEFLTAVRYASRIASSTDHLVVFGIPPSRPDTGYGYVELGDQLESAEGETAYRVARFVEKPDWDTAVQYCASGTYLWNSGMFVWRTSVILDQFKRHMPRMYRQVQRAVKAGLTRAAVNRFYEVCDKESIDYGIMERAEHVTAVSAHFLWDDVGSWDAVARIRPGNQRHTTTVGRNLYEKNCDSCILVNESSRKLAAFGLDNVVMVATDDVVMAIPRSELPRFKEYLASLKKDGGFPSGLF